MKISFILALDPMYFDKANYAFTIYIISTFNFVKSIYVIFLKYHLESMSKVKQIKKYQQIPAKVILDYHH